MSLASGTRVGPFEIVAPIGAGGMGEVFRARDARLGRDVAVKILPSLFAADPDRLRRFEQEARAAAALNHPNILVLYEVGTTTEGVPYVVSELLEGETLRQTLERGALTPRKAIECGVQIASGLAAAHDKGIVHRDIKPENVFITKDGRVKILDFGLAKPLEAVSNGASVATMAHTDPGMVVGTAGYMSPEQLRGEPVDARTDVFSLGAVLYEMFCGERAFKGKTAVDTMTAILREDPAEFPPTLHASAPAIERIVRRCLEKNVHERFQSARDVTFAFEALSSASGVQSSVSGIAATPVSSAPPRRSRQFIAAALAALAVVAAYFAGARFGAHTPGAPTITQLTFRNGTVRGARFSPDGATVLYAASWDGEPIKTYSTRPGNPESNALTLPPADLLALSSKTSEMALALRPEIDSSFFTVGTLARAPLSGGAPREILEHVGSADFTADGSQMAAIIRTPTGSSRIEYPLGTERLTLPYLISDVRISPDGKQLAFIPHPGGGDDGSVQVLGPSGPPRTLSDGWLSIGGLAWAPGGRELWFTATEAGGLRALRAVTLEGRQRLLYRAPERMQLEDVSADGRVLVTGITLHSQVRFGSLSGKVERDLSWFDYPSGPTLSADGKLMSFSESGEGAGASYGIFVRPTNGDPAVRIADGAVSALSRDGTRIAIANGPTAKSILIAPTGPGTPRTVDISKYGLLALDWFPDNRRLAIVATEQGKPPRTYTLDTDNNSVTPLTDERVRVPWASPDGQWLGGSRRNERVLYDIRARATVPLKGSVPDDITAGWAPDSRSVLVYQAHDNALEVFRIDVTSGVRSPVATIESADKSGFVQSGDLTIAADGDHYAYDMIRQLSHLYLLKLPD